ncbi:MAG TPA: TolC family protein [Polyangiaceae bacterium]|nr:TolC family protein [Polyangiaceae bacterium]
MTPRTSRIISSAFLRPLLAGAMVTSALPALAAPAAEAGAPTLDSKLSGVLGRPGGLTADAVAKRAEATSYDVKAKRDELDAAAAGVDQALVGYFPKLSGVGRYTRLSPIDPLRFGELTLPFILNQYILQATLSVPISDYLLRIPQAHAAATKSQRAAAFAEKATRLKVSSDAKVSYYTWVRARLQEVVAEQAVEQAKAHLVDAKHAFEAGTVSKADVLRIESQVAQSQLLLERAHNFADVSETQIRVAMHDETGGAYEVGESVDAEVAPVKESVNLTAAWGEAKNVRLEVRALDESAGSLRDQAKVARANNYPHLDAFGDIIYASPNQRIFPQTEGFRATWDVGAQITWSPNDLSAGSATARSLDSRASGLLAQRQALEDGIRVEITQANNSLHEARAAIESTARGLAASEESYRVRRSLFQNGRATSVELTDAETDLTRARLEAINARVDLRIAQVRFQHAVGRDVPSER